MLSDFNIEPYTYFFSSFDFGFSVSIYVYINPQVGMINSNTDYLVEKEKLLVYYIWLYLCARYRYTSVGRNDCYLKFYGITMHRFLTNRGE